MKVEISKNARIKRDENYEVLRSLEQEISNRIRAEFANEVQGIKKENENYHEMEKSFREQAKELLKNVTPETLLRVKTQVGHNSTIINEYTGHIERKFNWYKDGTFDFISPDKYEGKPFTIGLSCLLSIEIL